jgi:hypothetical protein
MPFCDPFQAIVLLQDPVYICGYAHHFEMSMLAAGGFAAQFFYHSHQQGIIAQDVSVAPVVLISTFRIKMIYARTPAGTGF